MLLCKRDVYKSSERKRMLTHTPSTDTREYDIKWISRGSRRGLYFWAWITPSMASKSWF